ncbi:hypothetical protein LGL55_12470 [Clostridium tagluense]|uniref:hypothetical protein n=1 Tax=Clostridium TaxID=1485 RepID=UPI0013E967FC|nr:MULTISPECIES: hypothetical protein [Clostridium]MBZ9623615.1 hypothetical protein [Clostridium sp. FP2]MCB2312218.1 hypothetical protein [Clostridium tagluense]MCB2316805.1 hypothetical protein [Clostridium tagluense]MCB2321665.1 hypothetical protein [Clostridium tagluense]MCB2326674.1 hypothetical protein [Clostridium tagluense]
MNMRDLESLEQGIKSVKCEIEKEKFVIKWQWACGYDIVYIFKSKALDEIGIEAITKENVKIFTREEYREFNGYVESIREIDQYKFMIFKAEEINEKLILVKQQDGENEVIVCTGKPDIFYKIIEYKPLFSKNKKVKMKIICDAPFKKDVLCYVKKQGNYPESQDDGIKFDFIGDFHPGVNEMPSIEISRDEFVKIFIKDVNRYGSAYNLREK